MMWWIGYLDHLALAGALLGAMIMNAGWGIMEYTDA